MLSAVDSDNPQARSMSQSLKRSVNDLSELIVDQRRKITLYQVASVIARVFTYKRGEVKGGSVGKRDVIEASLERRRQKMERRDPSVGVQARPLEAGNWESEYIFLFGDEQKK